MVLLERTNDDSPALSEHRMRIGLLYLCWNLARTAIIPALSILFQILSLTLRNLNLTICSETRCCQEFSDQSDRHLVDLLRNVIVRLGSDCFGLKIADQTIEMIAKSTSGSFL